MVRKHGWQLPAHTLQVIAITVFCLLVVSYYAFFAPFAGGRIWEYVLIGVFSPMALLVFVLYVRCTAINPADPRIMSIFDTGIKRADMAHPLSARDISETGSQLQSSPSVVSRSSTIAANSSVKGSVGDAERLDSVPRKSCYNPLPIFCCVFVLEDFWKQEATAEQQGNCREALYCTLCNYEVRKSSKHCRTLDANETARAAARARASSSVLRPIHNRHLPDNELSSVGTVSITSSVSTDANVAARKEIRNNDLKSSLSRNSFAPTQSSRDEYDTASHGMSNFSSPSHVHKSVTLAPLPQNSTVSGHRFSATTHHMHSPLDEKVLHRGNNPDPLFLSAPSTSLLRDVRKTSVVWDPEAGRYISAPVTTMPEVRNRLPDPSSQIAHTRKPRPILPPQDSSSVSSAVEAPLLLQQAERRLTYTGDSIFFGGPLVNIPNRNNTRSEGGLVREGQDRLASTLHRDTRFRRDSTSNQLPVFPPGTEVMGQTRNLVLASSR